MSKPGTEALLRYPGSRGRYDGQRCICTRKCPAACYGRRRGFKACTRSWITTTSTNYSRTRGVRESRNDTARIARAAS